MKKQSLITYCASSHQPCEVWIIVLFSMQESEDFRAETGIQSQVFIWAFTFSRGWIRVYISYNIESCKCSGTHSSPLSSVSPQPGGTPLKIQIFICVPQKCCKGAALCLWCQICKSAHIAEKNMWFCIVAHSQGRPQLA